MKKIDICKLFITMIISNHKSYLYAIEIIMSFNGYTIYLMTRLFTYTKLTFCLCKI
jgi:hypothetical protein